MQGTVFQKYLFGIFQYLRVPGTQLDKFFDNTVGIFIAYFDRSHP